MVHLNFFHSGLLWKEKPSTCVGAVVKEEKRPLFLSRRFFWFSCCSWHACNIIALALQWSSTIKILPTVVIVFSATRTRSLWHCLDVQRYCPQLIAYIIFSPVNSSKVVKLHKGQILRVFWKKIQLQTKVIYSDEFNNNNIHMSSSQLNNKYLP